MKKVIRLLPLLLIAVVGSMMLWSCDDDKDENISAESLPTQAKTFITQYFPSASIVSVKKDSNEYEVVLSEGTTIDFNTSGEWIDVDAAVGKTIPNGFYPSEIDIYIGLNLDGAGINEISKTAQGYEVELVSGIELIFNTDGTYIGIDR